MKRLLYFFFALVAAIIGVIIFIALLPHLPLIGMVALVAILVLIGYSVTFAIRWGELHLSTKERQGQVIHLSEHGAYLLEPKLTPLHPASVHIARSRIVEASTESQPRELPVPGEVESLPASIQTFRELLEAGIVQQAIREGRMILGYIDRQLRYGSWLDLYSCGIGGVSGSGKTTTVRFLLFQAVLANGKLIMVDPHIGEPEESLAAQFRVFKNIHTLPPCDDEPGAVTKRVRWLMKEYTRRKARGIKGPALIFVLDEFNAIVRRLPDEVRKELADLLLTIAQEGRKFGLFAMLIGQRWSEQDLGGKNFGAAIRSSLASTLAHRFTDEDQARKLVGGKNGPRCLELEQGHYLFRDTQGALSEMVTPYARMDDGIYIQRLLDGESTSYDADFAPTSTRLQDTPTEVLSLSNLKLLQKPHEATNELSGPRLSPELENKYGEVIDLMAQENPPKQGEIISLVWGVTSGGGAAYQKAAEELRIIQRVIANRALAQREAQL